MHPPHVRPQVKALKPLFQRLDSTTTTPRWRPLPTIRNPGHEIFRNEAFQPSKPVHFEPDTFTKSLPAVQKWFSAVGNGANPNHDYLNPFASSVVPLELTTDNGKTFKRAEAPLAIFLEWYRMTLDAPTAPSREIPRLYLAQAPLANLPPELRADLPTPELVLRAGQGDVYDANLWMGVPPDLHAATPGPEPESIRAACRAEGCEDGAAGAWRRSIRKGSEEAWKRGTEGVQG